MIITAGKINVTVDVYFVDDDGGTSPGEPTTGLLFSDIETGGSASYHRQGAARVDFTLITQTVAGVHADGGFIEIDAVNMPGLYRLDVPDAAFATGVDYVVIQLVAAGANNTMMRPLLIDLTDVDLRDSVRGGMTALPNAAADGVGGLPISDAGGLDLDTILDVAVSTRLAPTTAARTLDVAATGEAGVDFGNVTGSLTNANVAAFDANERVDVGAVAGVSQSGTNLEASTDTILIGVASGTPTTTTMISDIAITDDDQFNGRTIIFASDTTTAGLRGQATDITGCTAATNTLTFTALTQAPVSGEAFVIV